MTQTEKLALRLSQFPNRLVRVLAYVDHTGALVFWVVDEDKKVEGANGNGKVVELEQQKVSDNGI